MMTRQAVPVIDRTQFGSAEGLSRGAYILADAAPHLPQIILIATGSEVHLALEAYEKLRAGGIRVRVVSMPSWELFERQPRDYRNQVLPPGITARVSIEAGVTHGWPRYIGWAGEAIGIDHFGASAPGKVLLEKFGFISDNIVRRVKELLNRSAG